MTTGFLYKHCAECGKRIPHTEVRCEEHKIEEYGTVGAVRLELKNEKNGEK